MYLIDGIICGMILSLPFGPLAIYCMEKTLSEGRYKGFVSALGMITIDVVYGLIAFFGFQYVEGLLHEYQSEIKIISGIFIFLLGLKIFKDRKEVKNIVEEDHFGYIKSYITTIFVAFTNPLSIFTFMGLYALLGVSTGAENTSFRLTLGIIIGGGTQWFLITWLLSHYKKRITLKTLELLRHYASVLIMIAGILISLSSFFNINI